jgi:hypothetical protein
MQRILLLVILLLWGFAVLMVLEESLRYGRPIDLAMVDALMVTGLFLAWVLP